MGRSGAALGGAALKDISSFGLYVNAIGDSPAFANGETMVNGTLYYDDIIILFLSGSKIPNSIVP